MTSPLRGPSAAVFPVLAINIGAFALLQSLLVPVLPTIQRDLATTPSVVTWTLTAWLLTAAVATPILGKVGDMIGKRRTIMISLFAAALGSLIATLAPTIELVITGRVVQGLAAGIFPLTYGIIRDEFPAAKLPGMIGAVSAIIAIGSGLGTVLAGPIDALFGWRALFWIPMLVFLGGAAATRLVVPESEVRNGGSINWLAATLMAGWLVALLLPLSFGTQWGWTSPSVIGLGLAAVLLFAGWVMVETRASNPLIDMKLMRLTPIWTNNLASLLFGAAMFGVFAFLPQLAQMPAAAGFGFGASVTESGFLILPMTLAMAVAGFLSGRVSAVIGAKYQLVGAAAAVALASVALALLHDSPLEIMLAGGLFGIGLGFGVAATASLIVLTAPAGQIGVASGMNSNLRTIGGSIGAALMSALVTGNLQANDLPAEAGFTQGFLAMGGLAAIAILVALLVPDHRPAAAPVAAAGLADAKA
jgi:MFS family permease